MKPVRATVSAAVVAAALLAFFFLPLPVSRVRDTGLVQLQPDAVEKVPVLLPGRPDKVLVSEGQHVKQGAEIAVFSSFPLDRREIKLVADMTKELESLDQYRFKQRTSPEADTGDDLGPRINASQAELGKIKEELESVMAQKKQLVLKAPRTGVVMGLPRKDELYHPWEKSDLEKPFCHIGDPTKLRILVPVSPDDYALISSDLAAKKSRGQELEVTVRIQGFASEVWKGTVSHLPKSADKTVPLQLTTKGGGPLAMKPGSDPNNPEPQGQVYLVGIDFKTPPNRAVSPGTLGQVKIHCEYRSGAWWAWRTLSATFDLGLW